MKKVFAVVLLLIVFNGCLLFNASAQTTPRVNHMAFYVVNLQVSTHFYRDIVGLDTIPEPFHDGRHTWFLIGPKTHLHIISGAAQKTDHDKNTHLCFTVPSVTDFIEVLKKNNVSFESWTGEKGTYTNRVDGVKQIYFQDPDGFWIEINDAKS
ncbi:MAG: VOC family protein [Bacteroidetes bacterium]|nr:VOC family protein [Bacteroidota bacterium]